MFDSGEGFRHQMQGQEQRLVTSHRQTASRWLGSTQDT